MLRRLMVLLCTGVLLGLGYAESIRIGVVASATGPAAALGKPEADTFKMLQDMFTEAGGISGVPVEIIVLDSATDASKALTNVTSLIEEDNVHAVICCTISSNSLAIIDTVQNAEVPTISMAASAKIIEPVEERYWVFKTPQTDEVILSAVVDDLKANGYEKIAMLALDDAFGEEGVRQMNTYAEAGEVDLAALERHGRVDTNVTPQVLRVVLEQPDAVIVWGVVRDTALVASGLRARGYEGPIYASHGVGNPTFFELGGEDVEGVRVPIGPMVVIDEIADDNSVKAVALDYIAQYEALYGEGTASTFGAHAWDAMLLLNAAFEKVMAEGADLNDVPATRQAVRDALENLGEVVGVHGVFNITSEDHLGLDDRSVVLTEVRDGQFRLLSE